MPPGCAVSWLGDTTRATKTSLKKKLRSECGAMAETAARAFVARLLKEHPIPRAETEGG